MGSDTHIYDAQIRVLIYQEDGGFVAHALEMDLVAYGDSEEEAKAELERLILAQISFALHKKEDHLIMFKAEKEFFDRWEAAQENSLKALATDKPLTARAIFIQIPKRKIRELLRNRGQFEPIPECA